LPKELAVKRVNDECYHCIEKFMPNHKCMSKDMFLLELDDDIEEDTTANELGISLHALTGIDIANIMKLHMLIKGKTLVALVDTGSTHTFIKKRLLPHLGLAVTPWEGLTMKVANGEHVTSDGVCREVGMDIGSEHFSTNIYVLPLDGFDIILGVQWLHTLGPILSDFDDLAMSFWHDGRTMRWTGVGIMAPLCNTPSTPQDFMKALFESFADIFTEPYSLPPPR
jgi:predicted aspartyl protease